MYLKGPILITTAFGLIVSGAVMMHVDKQASSGPRKVETVAGKNSSCSARGLDTALGRLGCSNGATTWSRRTTSGGAVFISSDKD